jgi:tetratricopeptide (TPR) repeat protein
MNPQSIPGMLGLASMKFNQQKYRESADLYKKVIIANPETEGVEKQAANIRLSLGYCYYYMGKTAAAVIAFERAAQIDPSNTNAHMALAVIEMYGNADPDHPTRGTPEGLSKGIAIAKQCYAIDKSNSMVLHHLADHYFYSWVQVPDVTLTVSDSNATSVNTSRDLRGIIDRKTRVKIGVSSRDSDIYVVHGSNLFTGSILPLDRVVQSSGDHTQPLFIYTKDYDKALNLAQAAFHNTKNENQKAESLYLIGLVHQAKRNYADAYTYFKRSIKASSNVKFGVPFMLPVYGLAQMHVHRATIAESRDEREAELQKAAGFYKKVIANEPLSWESHQRLASVYMMQEPKKVKEAEAALRDALKISADNHDSLFALAEIMRTTLTPEGMKEAADCYNKGMRLMTVEGRQTPCELLVNSGAVHAWLKRFDQAITLYSDALVVGPFSECKDPADIGALQGVKKEDLGKQICYLAMYEATKLPDMLFESLNGVSIMYNMAKVWEAVGFVPAADALFHRIVDKHPSYHDAWYRLGLIYKKQGNKKLAMEMFRSAESHIPKTNTDARCNVWLQFAYFHSDNGDWLQAKTVYRTILRCKGMENDGYASIALAYCNMHQLQYCIECPDQKSRDALMDEAVDLFKKVLKKEPHNAYAALGLAGILSLNECYDAAREIYANVREAAPDIEGGWLGLAHMEKKLKKFPIAINMYKEVLKRFPQTESSRMNYLGTCYAEAAEQAQNNKLQEEAKALHRSAIATFKKAIHTYPHDPRLWWNLAVNQEAYMVYILGLGAKRHGAAEYDEAKKEWPCCKAGEPNAVGCTDQTVGRRTLSEVQGAVDACNSAIRAFTWLIQNYKEERKHGFSPQKAREHLEYCQGSILSADAHLRAERRRDEEATNRLHTHSARVASWDVERRREKEEEEKAKLEKERRIEAFNAEQAAKVAELRERWRKEQEERATTAAVSKNKKKGKKGKKDQDDEGIVENVDEDAEGLFDSEEEPEGKFDEEEEGSEFESEKEDGEEESKKGGGEASGEKKKKKKKKKKDKDREREKSGKSSKEKESSDAPRLSIKKKDKEEDDDMIFSDDEIEEGGGAESSSKGKKNKIFDSDDEGDAEAGAADATGEGVAEPPFDVVALDSNDADAAGEGVFDSDDDGAAVSRKKKSRKISDSDDEGAADEGGLDGERVNPPSPKRQRLQDSEDDL